MPDTNIRISADLSAFEAAVAKVQSKVADLDQSLRGGKLQIDTGEATRQIEELEKLLWGTFGDRPEARRLVHARPEHHPSSPARRGRRRPSPARAGSHHQHQRTDAMIDPATKALISELGALLQTARNELDAHADSLARLDAELRSAALYAQDLEGTFDAFATVLRNIEAGSAPRPAPAIAST